MAAEDFERAERLVAEHTPMLYTNGKYTTIDRWIESLPHARVCGAPALCWCAALTALGLGHNDALTVWLRLGEHAAEVSPDADPVARLCLLDLRSTTTIGRFDRHSTTRRRPITGFLRASGMPPRAWPTAGGPGSQATTTRSEILTEGAEEAAVLGAPALEAYCCALLAMIAHTERDPRAAGTW